VAKCLKTGQSQKIIYIEEDEPLLRYEEEEEKEVRDK
jgi:hypothetical protein